MSEKILVGHAYDLKLSNVYVKIDGFGRAYIDSCASNAEHHAASANTSTGKRTCRTYVEDLFESFAGRGKGDIEITVNFRERE